MTDFNQIVFPAAASEAPICRVEPTEWNGEVQPFNQND